MSNLSWCLMFLLAAFWFWRWYVVSQRLALLLKDRKTGVRAERRWRVQFHPSGGVILFLEMHLDDDVSGAVATVHVVLEPGPEADDVRRRIRRHQAGLVEMCLKAGMRVPTMTEAAPGAPRKEDAR